MENQNIIYGINGPIVTVKNARSFSMMEMVYVGHERLVGEVIGITNKVTTIQVYEETTGLTLGEPIYGTGSPMNLTLGPGIMSNIFDGIARPLKEIAQESGTFIARGSTAASLDEEKLWDVTVTVKEGDKLVSGDVYAEVPESASVLHKCMFSPKLKEGVVTKVYPNGKYKVHDTVVEVKDKDGKTHSLTLCQQWPIRAARPVAKRVSSTVPLITGQRIQDTLFPITKGGTACIPGAFGSGKTMTQHQLAKWCDADIIIYVGCGERGNEMTQVLEEFGELIDPRTGRLLTDRTVLIANTSNMPVAAREASIYTGITLAEYYRDMGYHVAMMATLLPVGRKLCVKFPAVWKKCLRKKASRHTCHLVWQSSMSVQVMFIISMAQKVLFRSSARFLLLVVTSLSQLRKIRCVSPVASGRWISPWLMPDTSQQSTGWLVIPSISMIWKSGIMSTLVKNMQSIAA